jgi:23S rRNA pseudouridine2605 synthase
LKVSNVMSDTISDKGERIAKRLARAGVCSRRDAEKLIGEGRVSVDGKVLSTPATLVTDAAIITVDGKAVGAPERSRLWRYHKPRGRLTTNRDPQGRATIYDDMPPGLPRVISVGRLDYNSEGLLLLTNDGELARQLELPGTAWLRRYRVRAFGGIGPDDIAKLARGMTISGIHYGPIEVQVDRDQGDNVWLTIGLREGKNREIRRVLDALGLKVSRLIRTAYGPFQLGRLEPGEVEEVPNKVLVDQLGRNPGTATIAKGRPPATPQAIAQPRRPQIAPEIGADEPASRSSVKMPPPAERSRPQRGPDKPWFKPVQAATPPRKTVRAEAERPIRPSGKPPARHTEVTADKPWAKPARTSARPRRAEPGDHARPRPAAAKPRPAKAPPKPGPVPAPGPTPPSYKPRPVKARPNADRRRKK